MIKFVIVCLGKLKWNKHHETQQSIQIPHLEMLPMKICCLRVNFRNTLHYIKCNFFVRFSKCKQASSSLLSIIFFVFSSWSESSKSTFFVFFNPSSFPEPFLQFRQITSYQIILSIFMSYETIFIDFFQSVANLPGSKSNSKNIDPKSESSFARFLSNETIFNDIFSISSKFSSKRFISSRL